MNYAIELSEPAMQAFRSLPIPLQELVIDKIDELALGAGLIAVRPLPSDVVSDATVRLAESKHYAFIEARYHDVRQVIEIRRIGYFKRPLNDRDSTPGT